MSSVTFLANDWMNIRGRKVDLNLGVMHNTKNIAPLTRFMFRILCFPNVYILIVKTKQKEIEEMKEMFSVKYKFVTESIILIE